MAWGQFDSGKQFWKRAYDIHTMVLVAYPQYLEAMFTRAALLLLGLRGRRLRSSAQRSGCSSRSHARRRST